MPPLHDLLLAFWNSHFVHTFTTIVVAFALGLAIGFERQWRQRTAGLRTNVLVAVGAAAFSELGMRLFGPDGATRIIAYVVSGIGFLGAGVIVKDGTNVRGLNTAATLWCSGAVGAFTGSELYAEATALTCAVLAGNTLLRPLVNWINRRPIVAAVTEAEYRVHVTCEHESVSDVRDLLDEELDRANFPPSGRSRPCPTTRSKSNWRQSSSPARPRIRNWTPSSLPLNALRWCAPRPGRSRRRPRPV